MIKKTLVLVVSLLATTNAYDKHADRSAELLHDAPWVTGKTPDEVSDKKG
jgi:hypothetical protein